jgi:site-specific DNA-methyltransferase (adenine-specific)
MHLHNEDCLDYLQSLASESVDMVLTDPPYFKIVKNDWDNQWKTEQEYLNWCLKWTRECIRVLKPGGSMIVWGTDKTDTYLNYRILVNGMKPGLTHHYQGVWSYEWGAKSKKNITTKHELWNHWTKGKPFTFNGDDIRIPYKMQNNTYRGKNTNHPLGKIPTSVWEKNNITTSKEHCGWHPTTKNLFILDRMIRAYTNPGEVVLDIFSGSGSTAIACERAGRRFWGCEKDADYYNKSLERIECLK